MNGRRSLEREEQRSFHGMGAHTRGKADGWLKVVLNISAKL
jgi:hypothetical protein